MLNLDFSDHYRMQNAVLFENEIFAQIERLPFDTLQKIILSIDEGRTWKIIHEGYYGNLGIRRMYNGKNIYVN